MKVLVLDDEPIIALNTKRMLTDLGAEVIGPALSAEEALAAIGEGPDAALLDVNLGGGEDSFGVAQALAERGVPFAFVTGYAEKVFPEAFAGRPRLIKPVSDAALGAAVDGLRREAPHGAGG
jgi:CheY-like chemotaxis protein